MRDPHHIQRLVVEASPSTGYSKVRVLFDSNESRISSLYSNPVTTSSTTCNSPITLMRHSSPGRTKTNALLSNATTLNKPNGVTSAFTDISEPFWIQLPQVVATPSNPITHLNQSQSLLNTPVSHVPITPRFGNEVDGSCGLGATYSNWCDPDEAFIIEVKKNITMTDKIIFWEMAKAIMEMPKLSEQCDSIIRNSKDLASVLKRTEFRFLWSPDAPDLLPKDAASELVSAAYVGNF